MKVISLTTPGYYFVPKEICPLLLSNYKYVTMSLIDFLRRLNAGNFPEDIEVIAVQGLDDTLTIIPSDEVARFLHSQFTGKGDLIYKYRLAIMFIVSKIRKDRYYYVIPERGEKLRLNKIFGSRLKPHNAVIFGHPSI